MREERKTDKVKHNKAGNYIVTFYSLSVFIFFMFGLDQILISLDAMVVPLIVEGIRFLKSDTFLGKFLLSLLLTLIVSGIWKLHKITLKYIEYIK